MTESIAFFDFDGTITTKDTLLEFIRFAKGNTRFYLGFGLQLPWLVAMKLKLISNQAAKEKVLGFFFKGDSIGNFDQTCIRFSVEKLPSLIRAKAVQQIKQFQKEGTQVVIVSASPENWIRPWTESMNLTLLGSCLEVTGGKITGKLNGKNCHGEEKVRRILARHVLHENVIVHAYGDTRGDLPMLKLATHAHYKPFRD